MTTASKCACSLGNNELARLRIFRDRVHSINTFFDTNESRPPQFAYQQLAQILTAEAANSVISDSFEAETVVKILNYIRIITLKDDCQPNVTELLVLSLMEILGYRSRKREILIETQLSLRMNGNRISTPVDVCVVDTTWPLYHLLVIDDKHICRKCTAFAQMMAACIAAFQTNNIHRLKNNLPEMEVMIFPAMIWRGTSPSFYLLKLTKDLADACKYHTIPQHETHVREFDPLGINEFADHDSEDEETLAGDGPLHSTRGMTALTNRHVILKVMENFKDYLPRSCHSFPVGWARMLTEDETQSLESASVTLLT